VRARVAGPDDGLGFVGDTRPNEIYENTTGVDLVGRMHGQHISRNNVGVTGSGILGGGDLEHANRIEANAVGARFEGEIQFNQFLSNGVGIDALSDNLIHHNVIARGSEAGILVQGRRRVQIVGNTFYTPTGDNLRLQGGAGEVEVRNNIFWAEAGYNIYVANDSQSGFFSDFNLLHASGSGKLVYWSKDFTDILDWQADVAQFDLHSSGRTVVNPSWSEPRFVNRARDDYSIFDLLAGQRFTSPTIDAGDPAVDLALLVSPPNLLSNPGFESGLSGWEVNTSAATRGSSETSQSRSPM